MTGRANYEEVDEDALADLSVSYPAKKPSPVDVCLASSMLEVGVDIDRLALLAVVGQPKTTAQYIQVTGRVGRRWWESPGLVVTLYAAARPRDRSHFEKFRSYHEKLYAQVEPASVTPFSPPALERALHAVMLAYVRQFSDKQANERPWPYPADSHRTTARALAAAHSPDRPRRIAELRAGIQQTSQKIGSAGSQSSGVVGILATMRR